MIMNEVNGIKFLTFESFTNTGVVNHCFSTRVGGVSEGIYSSLNLGLNRGDDREKVLKNYRLISEAVGFSPNDIVFSNQIHKTNIHIAKDCDRGNGYARKTEIKDKDGFITNEPNIVLTTFHADCIPLFFLDSVKKVIGLSHAGWRGTVDGIGKITVEKMVSTYSCCLDDILVGIGPGIGFNSFEVDSPVVNKFTEKLYFASEYIVPNKNNNNKFNIDLEGINKRILLETGIKEENIECALICTVENQDLFYSHRATAGNRGSMAAFLEIRK